MWVSDSFFSPIFPLPSFFSPFFSATAILTSWFHPQTTSSLSKLTRNWRKCLLLASHNPTSWSHQLIWVEYAHNTIHVAATGMPPFPNSVGYQPHLFASQEPEAHVPFTQAFVQWCRLKWERASKVLFPSGKYDKAYPKYVCGQRVWLSTKDLFP